MDQSIDTENQSFAVEAENLLECRRGSRGERKDEKYSEVTYHSSKGYLARQIEADKTYYPSPAPITPR